MRNRVSHGLVLVSCRRTKRCLLQAARLSTNAGSVQVLSAKSIAAAPRKKPSGRQRHSPSAARLKLQSVFSWLSRKLSNASCPSGPLVQRIFRRLPSVGSNSLGSGLNTPGEAEVSPPASARPASAAVSPGAGPPVPPRPAEPPPAPLRPPAPPSPPTPPAAGTSPPDLSPQPSKISIAQTAVRGPVAFLQGVIRRASSSPPTEGVKALLVCQGAAPPGRATSPA